MNQTACTVMIVDDEPIILRSLKAAIPWEQLGMKLVGQARNGEEALQLFATVKPDIMISDIRMPSIDGITLMRMVMEQYPDTIFIILSGYGEFEYAREAVRNGAFNYLLKPIDHDELQDALVRAKERIDAARRTWKEQDYLRRSICSLSLIVRERMFESIIEGTNSPDLTRAYWLDEWELRSPYYMGLVNLDDYETVVSEWSSEEKRLWYFAVGNILNEYLLERNCFTVFPFHNGEWLFIMQQTDAAAMQELAHELIATIKQCTKLSVSVGISRQFEHISTLQRSYQSCRQALCHRFTNGKEMVYMDEDETERRREAHGSKPAYPMDREQALTDAIRTLDWAAFDNELSLLSKRLMTAQASRDAVSRILVQLVIVLHRQLEAFHAMHDAELEPLLQQLTRFATLEDMITAIRLTFREWVQDAMDRGEKVDSGKVVQKVMDYVKNNYHHDLGIDEVAEYAGLSCSHFCVLFKQETGFTFLEYLTKYRIDKACSILRNSEVKVFQIAPLVGYQDPRYFTQVFKKVIGKTPSEYRTAELSS